MVDSHRKYATWKSKIKFMTICPRCEQDYLFEAVIKPFGEKIIICPECDAFWQLNNPPPTAPKDYGSYIESKGFFVYSDILLLLDKYESKQ